MSTQNESQPPSQSVFYDYNMCMINVRFLPFLASLAISAPNDSVNPSAPAEQGVGTTQAAQEEDLRRCSRAMQLEWERRNDMEHGLNERVNTELTVDDLREQTAVLKHAIMTELRAGLREDLSAAMKEAVREAIKEAFAAGVAEGKRQVEAPKTYERPQPAKAHGKQQRQQRRWRKGGQRPRAAGDASDHYSEPDWMHNETIEPGCDYDAGYYDHGEFCL